MAWLEKIREKGPDTSGRTNIVIVPGNNGETLEDQTCSHFPNWLDDIVASKNKSTVVWMFRHDIRIDSIASWFAYCEAGERLLQSLTRMQSDDGFSDDNTLILIGHKLGSFMLKKALLEAHRSSHHPHIDALLNTIETLVMLGDPNLHPGNRNEWIPLISKCLPYKILPKHLDCPEDARCLQHIASCFEEFTLLSTLFQVSCAAESKRKHFLKFRAEDHRCICSATMTVRMWTTMDEEVIVPPGEGDKKNCAFYPKSTLYNRLLSIPNYAAQSLISGNSVPLPVLGTQTSDGLSGNIAKVESVGDLTSVRPAPSQTASLITHPRSLLDTTPVTKKEFANNCSVASASNTEDETNLTGHGDQHCCDPNRTPPHPLAAESNDEAETLPCSKAGNKSLEDISFEQARHENAFNDLLQKTLSEASSVLEPPRLTRRSPFLLTQVPRRDSQFFGREELLITLENLLTPVCGPSDTQLGGLDCGTIVVLHGTAGVGKSAIALELIYRTQAMFDIVLWLRASSKLHLAQSFHEAAVSLGLVQDRRDHNHESSRQKLIAWLSTTSSKTLLVFDDADDLQILPKFIPNPRRSSIIVTSRQPLAAGVDIEKDECFHKFQVDPFVVEDATEFLRLIAPCAFDAANSAADVATLTTIAENCGYLPLALRRVGMILNDGGPTKNTKITTLLGKHASRILSSHPFYPLIDARLSSASIALASVIAFFDPYRIDDAILLGAQRHKSAPLTGFPMNDDDYFDAKHELVAQALLTVDKDPSIIHIHRVTAKSLRAKLDPDCFSEGFQSACRLLEARWPSRRKMKNILLGNWPEFDTLHGHIHNISSILAEHNQNQEQGGAKCGNLNELSNSINSVYDTYLRLVFLSTWYNARRGNAEEDEALVRLAHGLIARPQRSDLRSLDMRKISTNLPERLIDVGLDNTECPRLVNTAGQTGCYVALSYRWSSRSSSETQLTKSNMGRLQQKIEPTETPRCVSDAINFTRSLGVRYIWVDSLCVIQDDLEAPRRISDCYRSAVCTIVASDKNDDNGDCCIDSSVLQQPFSIFLNWSRPVAAKSCSDRLFAPVTFGRSWLIQETILSLQLLFGPIPDAGGKKTAHDIIMVTQANESGSPHEDVANSDGKSSAETVRLDLETSDTRFDVATREIGHGIRYVEAGSILEALASFMKAKELVSAFQTLTPMSWRIHAAASAHIALVYRMNGLPAKALDFAATSLAMQERLPQAKNSATLEKVRLHFIMGGIYNTLNNPDEGLNHCTLASKALEEVVPQTEDPSETADWNAILALKFAEHRLRNKDYKEAHALLQRSLDRFQSQDSLFAQAHLARTLHWQSVVYEAQGSKIMGNAIKAAATQTWIGVREARGRAVSEGVASLSTEDFDGEVEYWYR